jgi:hypothetical protein
MRGNLKIGRTAVKFKVVTIDGETVVRFVGRAGQKKVRGGVNSFPRLLKIIQALNS